MKKILHNRIATLAIAAVLLLFAVVMLLGAFEVRAFSFTRDVLRLLVAVVLLLYVLLFLSAQARARRGMEQKLVIGEMVLLLLLAFSQISVQFFELPLFSVMQVCAVFGFVIALRFSLEIVMAYLAKNAAGGTPLWQICLYLLGFAFGVWQMAAPTVRDKHFLFVLGSFSLLGTAVFVFFTVKNFKAQGKDRSKKAVSGEKKTALPSAEGEG